MEKEKVFCKFCKHFKESSVIPTFYSECIHITNMKDTPYEPNSDTKESWRILNLKNDCQNFEHKENK